ncbi:hypothetical protein [Pendulispora albinea]|uniref:Uncharacterized protein n=1 Tax=Pendulispora albinea TaxID=2741071 RepID=A0ABZ2LMN0_9BACT
MGDSFKDGQGAGWGDASAPRVGGRFSEWLDSIPEPPVREPSTRGTTDPLPRNPVIAAVRRADTEPMATRLPVHADAAPHLTSSMESSQASSPPSTKDGSITPPRKGVQIRESARIDAILDRFSNPRPLNEPPSDAGLLPPVVVGPMHVPPATTAPVELESVVVRDSIMNARPVTRRRPHREMTTAETARPPPRGRTGRTIGLVVLAGLAVGAVLVAYLVSQGDHSTSRTVEPASAATTLAQPPAPSIPTADPNVPGAEVAPPVHVGKPAAAPIARPREVRGKAPAVPKPVDTNGKQEMKASDEE